MAELIGLIIFAGIAYVIYQNVFKKPKKAPKSGPDSRPPRFPKDNNPRIPD